MTVRLDGPRTSRFSPRLVPPATLRRLLVARNRLVSELVEDLSNAVATGSGRYDVVTGPRGAGKSHVLALAVDELERGADRPVRPALAVLDEEEHVGSIADLMARVVRSLSGIEGQRDPHRQWLTLTRTAAEEVPNRAVEMLEAQLGERPLVLVLENLDQVLVALRPNGQKRLRAILQKHPNWSVLATARTWGPVFTSSESPFYNAFYRRTLDPITPQECRELLVKLAVETGETKLSQALLAPEGGARVRTIHAMTGGNPRAMALIFPYLVRHSLDDLAASFYDLADELTPYFQEQMARLPTAQQPILEQLAENWRPLTVAELAARTFNTSQTTSGQLRYLARDGLVRGMPVGRHTFYEISDPLFRLARAMKRPDGIVPAFVRLLALWHTPQEIRQALILAPRAEVKSIWEAAASLGLDDGGGEYGAGCHEAIVLELQSDHREDALRIATDWNLKQPCLRAAIWEVLTLIRSRRDSDALDRLAAGCARYETRFASVVLRILQDAGAGSNERARGAVVQWLSTESLDTLPDEALDLLMRDGLTDPALLDGLVGARIRRHPRGALPPPLANVISSLGLADRSDLAAELASAVGFERLTAPDAAASALAHAAVGARDEALRQFEAARTAVPRPFRPVFEASFLASVGDSRGAYAAAIAGLEEDPLAAELREIACTVAFASDSIDDALVHAAWLARRTSPSRTAVAVASSLVLRRDDRSGPLVRAMLESMPSSAEHQMLHLARHLLGRGAAEFDPGTIPDDALDDHASDLTAAALALHRSARPGDWRPLPVFPTAEYTGRLALAVAVATLVVERIGAVPIDQTRETATLVGNGGLDRWVEPLAQAVLELAVSRLASGSPGGTADMEPLRRAIHHLTQLGVSPSVFSAALTIASASSPAEALARLSAEEQELISSIARRLPGGETLTALAPTPA